MNGETYVTLKKMFWKLWKIPFIGYVLIHLSIGTFDGATSRLRAGGGGGGPRHGGRSSSRLVDVVVRGPTAVRDRGRAAPRAHALRWRASPATPAPRVRDSKRPSRERSSRQRALRGRDALCSRCQFAMCSECMMYECMCDEYQYFRSVCFAHGV